MALSKEDIKRGIRLMGEFPECIGCFDEQPEEMCIAAVQADPDALRFVRVHTWDVLKAAIDADVSALAYAEPQDEAVCLYAVGVSPEAMKYIDPANQTEDMCIGAIHIDPRVWEHILDPTVEMAEALVDEIGMDAARAEIEDMYDIDDSFREAMKEKFGFFETVENSRHRMG